MNAGFSYVEQIGPESAGRSALDFLATRYTHSDRETWARRFEQGELELDGRRASGDELLRAGQLLVWHRPPWAEPEVPLAYEVVHEDEAVLVVHKPSGLPTAPAGGFFAHTLLALVRQRDPAWAPMHRLGRGTSGLVTFARTAHARSALQAAWRTHAVEKHYLGLASGIPSAPLVIRAAIGPVAHPRLGTVNAASPAGRPAETVLERADARGANSRVELRLVTGRPHQIRIHLASAGHPLVGDPLYGPGGQPRADLAALPGDLGYHLHAWRLAFVHPVSGRQMRFEAPAPEALR